LAASRASSMLMSSNNTSINHRPFVIAIFFLKLQKFY
jgi:hypothetical protein